jgi:hypothetical protein
MDDEQATSPDDVLSPAQRRYVRAVHHARLALRAPHPFSPLPLKAAEVIELADRIVAAEDEAFPMRTVSASDVPLGHRFEAGEGSSGMVCTRMVMRGGGGDACGATPAEHRLDHA